MNIDLHREEFIKRIRHALNLSEVDATDNEILEGAKDSFCAKRIELGMSLNQFKKELKAVIIDLFKED